ncbi:apolipoprotein N-acyltransferase [Paracoccus isoporae]|uniref:Apolipoprotein N-acyltransferase n=1 Tax=Paracoccus isoporae TaxID=591205 RepID=A0A1G7ERM1_9RHOB|nr:apolipoprotein N-acyltransferase [Paracoccus isoporae]SDE66055.1 apolipoprotein N-acyltransferase [Paracoccus isoporae]
MTPHPTPRSAGSRRRALISLAADLALGLAVASGQAPWGLWPLSLVALSLILLRGAHQPTARQGFRQFLAAGAGYFALSLSWIVEPFLVQPEIYGWMAPFAILLMALGGALFWALPCWAALRIGPPEPAVRAAMLAAALLLSDWLRGWIFTGFPWALLGHVWIETPVAQAASVVGAIGLSAISLCAAALPALLAANRPAGWRGLLPGAAAALLLIAAVWAVGSLRLSSPAAQDVAGTGKLLRLVQPNAEQALKWDPDWNQVFWDRLLTESAASPGAPRPDAVIWPETAVSFLLNHAGDALPVLSDVAGAPVLMGIQRAEQTRYYNSLVEIAPGGGIRSIYDKFHLVPFGEYMPWGEALSRFGIGAFAAQQGFGYVPGQGPDVLSPQSLPPVQPLICYEAIFPQHLRTVEGAEWLLQITNDAWFGTVSGPYQHLAQAQLRAIESGLPLMRAANTGITAAIDPYGRITDSLPLGAVGHIDAELPAPLPRTVWMRVGPLPVLFAALIVLGFGALRRVRRV